MASNYPGGLDSLATNLSNATSQFNTHPAHHNDLADAINKIEAELGINPSGTLATVAARLAQLDLQINNQTGPAYTLQASDVGKLVGLDRATASTLTVPADATVDFPIGTQIQIRQVGVGEVSVLAASGVTLQALGAPAKLAGQFAHATLTKVAANVWDLHGDLVSGSAVGGTTYYVAITGNDTTGDGTSGTPWRTIKKACETVPSGQGHTISVGAGTFDEDAFVLPVKTNLVGAGEASTTIRPNAGATESLCTLNGYTAVGNEQVIRDLRWDGVTKTRAKTAIRIINCRGITVQNCTILNFKGMGNGGGGSIWSTDITDCEFAFLTLTDNAGNQTSPTTTSSGDLGIGNATNCSWHDITITENTIGYAIKNGQTPFESDNSPAYANLVGCDFYNLTINIVPDSQSGFNSLGMEMWQTRATNCRIFNCTMNRTLSLTQGDSTTLASGHRWEIFQNVFNMLTGSDYAIECHVSSVYIHHNYFNGGLYPIGNFVPDVARDNIYISHNVFDNQVGPVAVMHFVGGTRNSRFYKNTVIMRKATWAQGVFSVNEDSVVTSSIDIKDNIFYVTSAAGDIIANGTGGGLGSLTWSHNHFFNLTTRGTNNQTANPNLPLSGGFPAAYVPPSGSNAIDNGTTIVGYTDGYSGTAPDLGAFEFGQAAWAVGRP